MNKNFKYVGIVKYPSVQLAAVYGLTDMLTSANDFIVKQGCKDVPLFCVTHWGLDSENEKLVPQFSTLEESASQQNIIIVPGSFDSGTLRNLSEVVSHWICDQYAGGAIASSVCKGAFVLARTGILNNRSATTHWVFKEDFEAEHPNINLQIDKIVVDEGDIITAGGAMAWLDLGLRLIHKFAGAQVMVSVAKLLLIDPGGREQKFYRTFSPPLDHGDELVIKRQQWLQANYAEKLSLKLLADDAAVSVRTLIRRFQSALDMSPTAYIQQVRIGKAKELLESSTTAVNQIAWQVGYEDPGSFRKVFQRDLGLTPAEYRRRFNANPL